jgi:protein involved in polysaccharide export with SLBB domain
MSINILFRAVGRFSFRGGLLLAMVFLAGCHTTPTPPAQVQRAEVGTGAPGNLEPEVFHVGDSVTVVFTDLPTPTPAFEEKVKDDGTITLLLNQPFTAAGKTRGDLEKEIRKRYVPDYYKYMTVTIKPKEQTLFYYLDGEVKAPARQTYIERTTVLKAIASAGGFTDFAKKKAVKLTRLDGRQYTVNCIKARTNPSLDLEVYPGDKVFVPRKIF